MKAASLIFLVAVIVTLSGAAGCREQSAAFPLSLVTLEKIHDGRIISFEERRGEILVHLADRFGDSHIHRLDYRGVPKEQALTMLKAKQTELEKTTAKPNAPANGAAPVTELHR